MTQPQHTVRVALGDRSYSIEIGAGLLDDAGVALLRRGDCSHAVVITDSNVRALCVPQVIEGLSVAGVSRLGTLVVPAGEASKSIEQADALWRQMLELGADRKTVVIALGGGVVGDLAGFIAATFARGLRLLQIPTTLLAQVDSSVGGKVGINLPGAKNMVGAFWQPMAVLVDTDVLASLPRREYLSGLAEVVKYGVILDADLFAYLETQSAELLGREPTVLQTIVARCCRLKANVVEIDEHEVGGARAVLNYGHTFAHAFEAVCGYGELLHGEAVSIGMQCAARLAQRLRRVDADFVERQAKLLTALGLTIATPDVDRDELLKAMARDKKSAAGQLRFILPTRLGHVELVGEVPEADVRAALRS